MTLARTAQASTPAVAIARILRGIGLRQGPGKDFRVIGNYRTVRVDGRKETERTGTSVLLLTRHAEDTVAKHADLIEDTARNTGWSFHVSIFYRSASGLPLCLISSEGSRVRETPPAPTAAESTCTCEGGPASDDPADEHAPDCPARSTTPPAPATDAGLPLDEPVYGSKGAELGTRLRESLRTGLGEQLASTLSIGDRYVADRQEVTVAYVWPNMDDTFTVHHQDGDPVRDMRFHGRSMVRVTRRAPRCACGKPWDECDTCDEQEWPEAIEDAYMGRLPARS